MSSLGQMSLGKAASAIGAAVTAVPAIFAYLTWSAEPQTNAHSMTEKFNEHVGDWSLIHAVSDRVFEELTAEASLEAWKTQLISAFEEKARREFIAMSNYFDSALVCAQAQCDRKTIYNALEARICVFWNKTWPYYEHLTVKQVIISGRVQQFAEGRNCRLIELESDDQAA